MDLKLYLIILWHLLHINIPSSRLKNFHIGSILDALTAGFFGTIFPSLVYSKTSSLTLSGFSVSSSLIIFVGSRKQFSILRCSSESPKSSFAWLKKSINSGLVFYIIIHIIFHLLVWLYTYLGTVELIINTKPYHHLNSWSSFIIFFGTIKNIIITNILEEAHIHGLHII